MKQKFRRNVILLVGISLLLLCCGIFYLENEVYGNVRDAQRITDASSVYTEAEIAAAMDVATAYFRAEFGGCRLMEMVYDEEKSCLQSAGWAKQYAADEAIVLHSTFEVCSPDAWKRGLAAGEIYRNWAWILVRNDGGTWRLKTWGYG